MIACETRNQAMVDLLLKRRAAVNETDIVS